MPPRRRLATFYRRPAAARLVACRRVDVEVPLLDRRQPVVAHAPLRQRGELAGELATATANASPGSVTRLTRPIRSASVPSTPATGEQQVHRPAVADETGQVDRPAVDERHAEAPAVHAEDGVGRRRHAGRTTAPAPARRRRPDPRWRRSPACEGEPRRPHRARAVVGHRPTIAVGERLEVGAGAEVAARAGQHGDATATRRRRSRRTPRAGLRRRRSRRRCGAPGDRSSRREPARRRRRCHAGRSETARRSVMRRILARVFGQTAENMQRLTCPTCGNEVFFDSLQCVRLRDRAGVRRRRRRHADDRRCRRRSASCLMRDSWRCNWRPQAERAVRQLPHRRRRRACRQRPARAVPRRPAAGAGPAQRARHRLDRARR